MAKLIALALLHQGMVRKHNEDNLYMLDSSVPPAKAANYERSAACADPLQIFAVADGMGGSGIGDVAARTALQIVGQQQNRLRPGSRFDFMPFARDTIDLANRSVCDQLAACEGLPVGTTLSLLAVDHDTAYTFSLGNSRIYLYRDGQLHQLTEDHTSQLPDRRHLTRYLGFMTDSTILEVENMTRTVLNHGDILLLTTDGVTDILSDEKVAAVLAEPVAFVQQIRRLRDRVLLEGGNDNLTLIGIKIQDPQGSPSAGHTRKAARQATGPVSVLTDRTSPREDTASQAAPAGQPYAGPKIKGNSGFLQNARQRRLLRPLLFFLLFILLGILLGKLLFSLPALLKLLFPH